MGGSKNLILTVRLHQPRQENQGPMFSGEKFKPGPPPSRMFLFSQSLEVFRDPAAAPSLPPTDSQKGPPL